MNPKAENTTTIKLEDPASGLSLDLHIPAPAQPSESVEEATARYMEQHPGMNRPAAYAAVLAANPKLYAASEGDPLEVITLKHAETGVEVEVRLPFTLPSQTEQAAVTQAVLAERRRLASMAQLSGGRYAA